MEADVQRLAAKIVQSFALFSENVVDGHGAGGTGTVGIVAELPRGRAGKWAERDFELGLLETLSVELEDEAFLGGISGAVAVSVGDRELGGLLAAGKVDVFGSELGRFLASGGALLGVCRALRRRAGIACAAEQVGFSGSKRTGGSDAGVRSVGGTLGDCVLGARRIARGKGGSTQVVEEASYDKETHSDLPLNDRKKSFLALI